MYDIIQGISSGIIDGFVAYWEPLSIFQQMYITYFCYIGVAIFVIGFLYKLFRRIFYV